MEKSIGSLRLGDRINLPVYPGVKGYSVSAGRVVYIHPEKRFFTLEFTTELGNKIRQSYIPHGPMKVTD